MSRTRNLTNKAIARKIRERKNFLNRVANFIDKLVCEKGRVLSISEHSAWTHIVWELRNFGGFTFYADLGQTMSGGNTIKVYYHPDHNFREGDLDSAWTPVLEVDFQTRSENDYRVKRFEEAAAWQKALTKQIGERAKKKLERWQLAKARKLQLIKEAAKLSIKLQ